MLPPFRESWKLVYVSFIMILPVTFPLARPSHVFKFGMQEEWLRNISNKTKLEYTKLLFEEFGTPFLRTPSFFKQPPISQ